MKKIIYLFFLATILSSCAEKVYLFNAKISSIDINGTKKYGPKNSSSISKLITDPLLVEPEYENLGRIISGKNVRDDIGFFDFIYRNNDYGLLDKAYMDFLVQVSIPKHLNNNSDIINNFKNEFLVRAGGSWTEQKKILFKPKWDSIRRILEKTTYREIPNNIVQTQKIESIFKGGITSNIKSELKKANVEVTAELSAKLENIVKSNVEIKGQYIDIEIAKELNDNLQELLGELRDDTPLSGRNSFEKNYIQHFLYKKNFVATGYSILKFEINYNTSKITKSEIGTIIDGIANLDAAQKNQLTSNIYSNFSITRDFKGESKSEKNYLVRYSYDTFLQKLSERGY